MRKHTAYGNTQELKLKYTKSLERTFKCVEEKSQIVIHNSRLERETNLQLLSIIQIALL